MSFIDTTHDWFERLSLALFAELAPSEALNLRLDGEDQTYVRFNRAQVRQSTAVVQRRLALSFQSEGRRLSLSIDLSGNLAEDLAVSHTLLERARAEVKVLPEDPFAVPLENHGSSDTRHDADYPDAAQWIAQIADAASGLDFAGLLASGPQVRAVRNSAGTAHWFATDSFFVDYSLFTINQAGENKAIKGLHAGSHWQSEAFAQAIAADKAQLDLLKQPARSLSPGEYRVYLAPPAVEKIIHMYSWGAVSYGAWKKGSSALQKLIEGEAAFSPLFSLKENFQLGLAPPFNGLGELGQSELAVIAQGRLENLLVSSRSAKEYAVPGNGADSGEGLRSPEVLGGELAEAEALAALGSGIYVGNLHYLNWSDPQNARLTGMTRYACFWVENGQILASIRDLRFDESLYRIFGAQLEALTRETHLFPSTDTYHRRVLGGCRVPGALLSTFRFTL